jgi:hypothetical protein
LRHQPDAIHAFDTRNSTDSQRFAASFSARSHRSPAAMPRIGSRSRKISSFQPSRPSQSYKATAWALFWLEWLRKMRDMKLPRRSYRPRAKRKDAAGDCHDAARSQRVDVAASRSCCIARKYRSQCLLWVKLRTRLPASYVRFDRLRTLRLSREVFGFVSRGDA